MEAVDEQKTRGVVDASEFVEVDGSFRQFGDNRVKIKGVKLVSGEWKNSVVQADKPCEVSILIRSKERIQSPIIGFSVKDRLGREIMADNTAYMDCGAPALEPGRDYVATFSIGAWPNLREDDYSLMAAVADGDLREHTQCHLVHDIVIFRSVAARKTPAILSVSDTTFSCDSIG
jgi:hypothetical protein